MTQPSDGGFQQAAGDLQGIRHGNDQIQQGIASGKLRMNPDSAEKAAQAYENASDKASDLVSRADDLTRLYGLGDYQSAQQLMDKFRKKASNGNTGASDLISQYSDELRRRADLFRKAAEAYRAQEEHISDHLNRVKKGAE
jgi:hypothetical protein